MGGLKPRALPWATLGRPVGASEKKTTINCCTRVPLIFPGHHLAPCMDNLPRVSSHPTGDTANPSEAPTGRPKVAQGNALGLSAPKYPRAEGPA